MDSLSRYYNFKSAIQNLPTIDKIRVAETLVRFREIVNFFEGNYHNNTA